MLGAPRGRARCRANPELWTLGVSRAPGPGGVRDRTAGADPVRTSEARLRAGDERRCWSSCSASPSAGPATTHSFAVGLVEDAGWSRASPATSTFEIAVPCTYDLELAVGQVTWYCAARWRGRRSALHFSGSIFYPGRAGTDADRFRSPGARAPRFGLPVGDVEADDARALPRSRRVSAGARTALERLYRRKAEQGATTFDTCVWPTCSIR